MIEIKSPELRLLLALIGNKYAASNTLKADKINWRKFLQLTSYHGLRNFILNDQQLISIAPRFVFNYLQNFGREQAKLQLQNINETKQLFTLFESKDLHPLLLKGNLLYLKLNHKVLLRESSDIDIILPANEIPKAASILINNGYTLRNMSQLNPSKDLSNSIHQYVSDSFFQELHFDKNSLNIDLHWHLYSDYLPFNFKTNQLYKSLTTIDFFNKNVNCISNENLFWSLLIHHGGKEYWLRLKNLVDIMDFLSIHQHELNWEKLLIECTEYKLITTFKNALWYLKHVFNFPLHNDLQKILINYNPKTMNETIKFWEKANYWNQIIPRLKFEWILVNSQDKGFNLLTYWYMLYLTYKEPNPFEEKKQFNLPARMGILIFLKKLMTWFFRSRNNSA